MKFKSGTYGYWKTGTLLFCFLLLLQQTGFIIHQPWVGDYWEHRAVLNELIQHPYSPTHPILISEAPHAFFSPYMVALGWVGLATSLQAVTLLNIASYSNFILILGAVLLLSKLFLPQVNPWKSFFLLLLFLLFCWGYDPPNFSSFFHFGTFPYTTPYPSTFSFVGAVFAATLFQRLLHTNRNFPLRILYGLLIIGLLWMILLSHPLTYLFAVSLFIFVLFQTTKSEVGATKPGFFRLMFLSLFFLIVPFALAVFWNYYPFYELLSYASEGHKFHSDSRELYSSLYFKLYPLGLLLLVLAGNTWKKIQNNLPLLLAALFLASLFFYGFVSGSFGLGRMIAFLAVFGQILLLKLLLETENQKRLQITAGILLLATVPYMFVSVKNNVTAATTSHSHYLNRPVHRPFELTAPDELGHRLQFLEKEIPKGSLVLADTVCSKYLPGLGARVIASLFPAYWIEDNPQRINDIRRFFYSGIAADRTQILNSYQPAYILLTPTTQHLLPELSKRTDAGKSLSKNSLLLLKLKSNQ